jgi:DNA-binding CsgD family transcriptional regulator
VLAPDTKGVESRHPAAGGCGRLSRVIARARQRELSFTAVADARPESAQELKEVIELQRSGAAFLRYRDGAGVLRLFPLDATTPHTTIGRSEQNSIALPWDEYVSGVHAEIREIGGEWTLSDEGLSRNGTFVNGERVSRLHRLRDGDAVRIGGTVIAFHAPAAVTSVLPTSVAVDDARSVRVTDAQRRVLVALCRPYAREGGFHAPASNQAIADELFLSVDAVKGHLRTLFAAFGVDGLPQNQKRARLADLALGWGLISEREL